MVSVGDLIEGYTDSQEQLDREWDEMGGFVSRLEMPFFYAAGNHDFSNEAMSRDWRARFGPSYYHFRFRDVLFLVLPLHHSFPLMVGCVSAIAGGVRGDDRNPGQWLIDDV